MKEHTAIYQHSGAYAVENGELDQYRKSIQENIACRDAIEAAISDHYRDNRLGSDAFKEVVEQFGYDRTLYVLANTVQHKDWDGRISRSNKEWAKTIPIVEDKAGSSDMTLQFILDRNNPGLVDLFLNQVRKDYAREQESERSNGSSAVNMETQGLSIPGHIGTWHTIDRKEVDGHTFWLMEHDTYGDEAACVIVDCQGKLSLANVYDGFDEHTVDLLRQEVMSVDRMPDDTISVDEMKDYGYGWGGMLPMREEAAAKVMESCTVYRLYGDDSEGLVLDAKEIHDHAARGGIFGVEKVEWKAALERENYLKAAEMSSEDDYGMIDGIINNGPKEKEERSSDKGGKSSIMDRLKAAKSEPHQDKPTPHKERKNDREL